MTVTQEAPEVPSLPFHAKPGDLATYKGEVFVHVLRGVWQVYRPTVAPSLRDRCTIHTPSDDQPCSYN